MPLDPADAALVEALATPLPGDEDPTGELVSLETLAERTELSLALLEAVVREGLLRPRLDDPPRFAVSDAASVRAGLALVEAGLPLAELLDLARRTDEAMAPIATHAVELFLGFVRDPVHGTSSSDAEASERLVRAVHEMLPAAERLVGRHFRQLVLAAAQTRLHAELAERGET
ncbi:MAG: hypothetical protein ACLGIR_09405 [Actinomycetes bacterium]